MKQKKLNITLGDLVPVIAFVVVFIFFTVATEGMILSQFNLTMIIDQSIQVIILACGMIFVVAQGSTDLTVGVNLAVSGIIALTVALNTGIYWIMFPVAIIVGLLLGTLNGFLVAKCKVSSFMVSIAMLIGMRGVATYLLTVFNTQNIPEAFRVLNSPAIKYTAFIIICAITCYMLEFTKIGRYSKAIGENEETARNVGIPVTKMKWLVFILSGLFAGLGALFNLISVGGTSMQMGSFAEMKVCMAIYFGGVLVTGGHTAKFYKYILGAISITLIIYGLSLMGYSATEYSETIEGLLLLLILFVTIRANNMKKKHKEVNTEVVAESGTGSSEK